MLNVIQLKNGIYSPFSCLFSIAHEFSANDFHGDHIAPLVFEMLETLYLAPAGVGLAANQVGVLKRICVIDIKRDGKHPLVLLNPKYFPETEDVKINSEVCLSFPNICVEVSRYLSIKVEYCDLYGNPQEFTAKDFLACVLQHEIDHLDGKPHITKAASPNAILPYEGNAMKKAKVAMEVISKKSD